MIYAIQLELLLENKFTRFVVIHFVFVALNTFVHIFALDDVKTSLLRTLESIYGIMEAFKRKKFT